MFRMEILFFIVAVVFGGFTSSVATSKGHDGVSWFLAGVFFGPLALIVSFFLGTKHSNERMPTGGYERWRRDDHEEIIDEFRRIRRRDRLREQYDDEIYEYERFRKQQNRLRDAAYQEQSLLNDQRLLAREYQERHYTDIQPRRLRAYSEIDEYSNQSDSQRTNKRIHGDYIDVDSEEEW